ncbi:MAG TPA: hypothetical protein VM070_08940, partial [Candidatus Saccharimonadales bacterium]|nr:hypothetical protein [Candidatus Saccharimonadales bacterium]
MTAANDFNYKVALASGLRDLQAGRLRQAEEQFRYLIAHFPALGGGYRGLAKVFVEQDDRAAALTTLRAGAASLAKGGDRSGSITLLNEAIPLGPSDAAVHRHLAAALELAGDHAGAVAEQRRFAHAAISAGDRESALREIRYALTAGGEDPGLVSIAVECGLPVQGFSDGAGVGSVGNASAEPVAPEPAHNWAPVPAADPVPAEPRRSIFAGPVAAPRTPVPAPTPPDPMSAPPPVESTDDRPEESADERA